MKTKKELGDLIDLKLWNKLQASFAQAIKLPVLTINPDGEIISISRDFPFFCQMIENNEEGARKCTECRKLNFEKLKKDENRILFYYCHADLLNIMVPITVKGEQVGAVVCESILQTKKNVPKCRKASETTKIPTVEFIDAINEMRIQKREDVENYAKVLYILSNTIPELVHQKVTSDQKINELTILHDISKMLSSTLEMDKMLETTMKFMKTAAKAKACSTVIIEENSKKRFEFGEGTNQYISFEQATVEEVQKTRKPVVIPNIESESDNNMSIISIPMSVKNKVIGAINIYGAPIEKMGEHDLNFLTIITNQTALAVQNAQQYEQIKELAITDKLTSLYNRRHFEKLVDTEIERSKRYSHPLSIALLDIDNFGHYNNTHGHPRGDELLENLSNILKQCTRKIDILGRYGGEEFIIVMPNTNEQDAINVTERIRKAIEEFDFYGRDKQPLGKVTASIGVVTNFNFSKKQAELVEAADRALYNAKNSGRNRVIHEIIPGNDPMEQKSFDDFVFKGVKD
ncbi:hypothetical protein DRJ17_02545 [Candidatus Woesearchaeota archaeon]|nr:MAG: hypothetical protein DRJ17_02545 [Candidatus Woesearchaeota archaeon]